MSRFLYPIRKLKVKPWIKYWLIKRTAGVLSEVLENLTSPITLTDSLRRKFKIFQIGGNSVQNGEPAPTNEVPIQNVTGEVEVKVENKNLLLVKSSDITPSSWLEYDENSQTFTIKQGSGLVPQPFPIDINLEVGDTITTSIVVEKGKIGVKDGTSISIGAYHTGSPNLWQGVITIPKNENLAGRTFTRTYTITAEVNSFEIFLNGSPTIDTDIVFKVMIEKGSTATDYVPHEEQTVTFPLSEGQVLHEGDTIEDKIVQRRKTLALNGTEDWIVGNNIGDTYSFYFTDNTVAFNTDNKINVLSNYFKGNAPSQIIENAVIGICSRRGSGQGIYLRVDSTIATNQTELKSYLAQQYANGTPVTVEYELETPIEIPFTEAQRTAKALIDKLYSYKGTTYISSNNVPSPTFTIQYVKEE